MILDWQHDRCIACLTTATLTVEHVIPQSIGGKLSICFLCKSCNDKFGHRLDARFQYDPSILHEVSKKRDRIPNIATTLQANTPYIATGPGGKARGKIVSQKFSVSGEKLPDGSFIVPTHSAADHIKRILAKRGPNEFGIQEALNKFDCINENEVVQLEGMVSAVKWQIDKIEPDLSKAKLLPDESILKIAFEFLAGLIGEDIYRDHFALHQLRAALFEDLPDKSDVFRVERGVADTTKLFHGICFEGNFPHATIQVRLFGTVFFRVHIRKVAVTHPILTYTHDLESGKDWLSTPEQS